MKKVAFLTVALSAVLALSACGTSKKEETKTSSSAKEETTEVMELTMGVMPSTDNIPLIVAQQQKFDEKNGVKIKLEKFKAAKDRDAAFQAGKLDLVSSDLIGVANYLESGQDVKIVGTTFDQFDLVVGKDTNSMKDLKDQAIALATNSGTEYAVDRMLEKDGLNAKDIKATEVPPVPTRLELLSNGKVAGAILPEPFVTMAKAKGLKVLESTRDIDVNPFAMTATEKVIKEKAKAIQGMYKAYDEAVEWMKGHDKEEYIQLFIDQIGFPETLKDQIEVPEYPKAQQLDAKDIEEAFAWAKERKLLTKDIKAEDVLSDVNFK